MKGNLNHVEIHAADIDAAKAFYKDFLGYFDWKVVAEFPVGFGMADGNGTSLWWFSTHESQRAAQFNRDGTGIGHIGIHVASREDVDTFVSDYMKPHGIEPQFDTPRARSDFGGKYYQVMFVDPEGLAVEVFTT